MASLLKPRETTKRTKMAGVTRAKAWITARHRYLFPKICTNFPKIVTNFPKIVTNFPKRCQKNIVTRFLTIFGFMAHPPLTGALQ